MSKQIALTQDAVQSLQFATETARKHHHHLVDTEHILIGALQNDVPRQAMLAAGLKPDEVIQQMMDELGIERDEPLDTVRGITARARLIMSKAGSEANQLGQNVVSSGHLALSILTNPGPILSEILAGMSAFDADAFRQYLRLHSPTDRAQESDFGALEDQSPSHAGDANAERSTTIATQATRRRLSLFWAVLGAIGLAVYLYILNPEIAIPIIVVVGGWIVSLTLHEFAHAVVAYWGGDHTVAEKGYLSLNPLNYTHPLLSLGLPLLFLAMGGIGLPGGAVYIERHRLRNKYWGSLVSLAGPFANLICLVVFSFPFWSGYVTLSMIFDDLTLWASIAFLCWLQVTAIFLNMLPIPPLDGFGTIEPFLPDNLAAQLRSYGSIGFLIIILIFFFPSTGDGNSPGEVFFDQVDSTTSQFNIEPALAHEGLHRFRFWDDS